MVAGGLKIELPTETPATPWLETVVAAASQTAAAEYVSPTPTSTSTATITATVTGTAYAVPVNMNAPLNADPVLQATSQQDGTSYWILLYFIVSVGFVSIMFIAYLRLVVFRVSPLKK